MGNRGRDHRPGAPLARRRTLLIAAVACASAVALTAQVGSALAGDTPTVAFILHTTSQTQSSSAGTTSEVMTASFAGSTLQTPGATGIAPGPCPAGLASVTIAWGDGETSAPPAATPNANGWIPVSGQHAYAAPGEYTATVASSDPTCEVKRIDHSDSPILVNEMPTPFVTRTYNHNRHQHKFTITAAPVTDLPGTEPGPSQGVAGKKCKKKPKKKSVAAAKGCKKKKKK